MRIWSPATFVFASIFTVVATVAMVDPHRTAPDPIAGYRGWKKVNKKPVFLNPNLSALCIGPMWWDTSPANPHVLNYFSVYVNDVGQKAMLSPRRAKFPEGSVIVKEKLLGKDESSVKLLTVMVKREHGFDLANGDWDYFVVDGKNLQRRNADNAPKCRSCHKSQKVDDFVYRTYMDNPLTSQLDKFNVPIQTKRKASP